jgi:hypothetical protein
VIDAYASGALPPTLAAIMSVVLSVALATAACLGFVRARRRQALARRAEMDLAGTAPLVDGETVLTGIVEHAPGAEVAVRVEVVQTGSESQGSGGWSHKWIETDRRITVRPFYLRLDDGQRVRVEPPRDVDVADALDGKVLIDRHQRVLVAELVPGERIHARGSLDRSGDPIPSATSYRELDRDWALGPAHGRMLLSSEPLGAGMRQRAAFHRRAAWTASIAFAVLHLTLVPYYTRLAGDVVPAKLLSAHHYVTSDSDGDDEVHYVWQLDVGKVEVGEGAYHAVPTGARVATRRGSIGGWQLGARPTIGLLHASLATGLVFLLLFLEYKMRRATRPWFRRKVEETGSGELPEVPGPRKPRAR